MAKRVRCSNDVFDRALATDGFSQIRGKEELLMHLGSFADRRLVRDGKVSLPGKVVTVARHLGSHLGEQASFAHELPRRRQATILCWSVVVRQHGIVEAPLVVWSTQLYLERPRRHSAPRGRAGYSVSGQRGRTRRADCHRVQDVSGSRLGEHGPTTPLAQSRASPKQSAQTPKSNWVPRTCTCG